jgi:SAM-dependent methyltransferase
LPPGNLTPKGILRWAVIAAGWLPVIAWTSQPDPGAPGLRYDALPMKVAQYMLSLAGVGAGDVVYDLGCGDGDIVIIAARRLGARAVCVADDRRRSAEIEEKARRAGVADRIRFLNEDFRATSIGDATVVMLRLSPAVNLELRPKLLRELKPGTLIVSHQHGMGDWRPELTAYVRSGGQDRPVYAWTVPRR